MTHLVAKISNFFPRKNTKDPVFKFFFDTPSREKKRLYSKALQKAQEDQKKILSSAK